MLKGQRDLQINVNVRGNDILSYLKKMAKRLRSKVFRKPKHWSEIRYIDFLKKKGYFRNKEEMEKSLNKKVVPNKRIQEALKQTKLQEGRVS
jgi:hypothetical protein